MLSLLPVEIITAICVHLHPNHLSVIARINSSLRVFYASHIRHSLAFALQSLQITPIESIHLPSAEPAFVAASIALLGFPVTSGMLDRHRTVDQVSHALQCLLHDIPPKLALAFSWKLQGVEMMKWASAHGHRRVVEMLLIHVDANAVMDCSETPPLGLACHGGHLDTVELLLKAGADPKRADKKNEFCPLNLAVQGNHFDVVNCLLRIPQVDVNQLDYGSWTPLHWSAETGSLHIANALLDHGAEVDASDEQRRTPLHWAITRGQRKTAKLLLERGANHRALTISRSSVIHLAAAQGSVSMVKLLLKAFGTNWTECVNARDATNRTPLHSASDEGHLAVVELLLKHGADASASNDDQFTPLHNAILHNHPKLIPSLIAHGSPLHAKTISGNTPLHLAAATDDRAIIELLMGKSTEQQLSLHKLRNNANHTPLHHACCLGSAQATKELLLHMPPEENETAGGPDVEHPLNLAIRFGHIRVVEVFVEMAKAWANKDRLLSSSLDFTIECFLSLRPYDSTVDRLIARVLVNAGARVNPIWDITCGGCAAVEMKSPFYKCMIDGVMLCQECREKCREETSGETPFHDPTHGFIVGDKEQIVEYLLNLAVERGDAS